MRRPPARRALLAALVLSALLLGASAARAALPPEIAAAIDNAAASSRRIAAQEENMVGGLCNPLLAERLRRQSQGRADAAMTSAVMAAINRRPDLAAEIVARAEQVAPPSGPAVLAAVGAAFPGLRTGIPGAAAVRPAAPEPAREVAATAPVHWYSQPVLAERGIATAPPNPAFRAAAPVPQAVPMSWYNQPALAAYGGAPVYPQPPLPAGVAPGPARAPVARVAAAGEPAATAGPEAVWDPLELVNRSFDAFNQVTDLFILRPVATVYSYTPDVVKRSIRGVLSNLHEPVVAANQLLQANVTGAGTTVGRFLVNSTVGVLGVYDAADDLLGWKQGHADFGQTLYGYGLGGGPYLELPLLGPSNLRDATGTAVDALLDPLTYLVNRNILLGRAAVQTVATRETLLEPLDELRRSSLDYYAGLRSAYYQNRQAQLEGKTAGGKTESRQKAEDRLFDDAR